jgi:adenylate cyclase
MDASTRLDRGLLGRVSRIGADPADSDTVRLRKSLLVVISLLILPISVLWGAIYLALGVSAGLLAWLYTLVSLAAIAVFSRTRDVDRLLRVELLDILLAPTISMVFVGGFVASGAVGLWGILAPLGALIFEGARAGVRWFIAFAVAFVVSGAVGEVSGLGPPLPSWFAPVMLALNIIVGGAVVFALLVQFVRQREEALSRCASSRTARRRCSSTSSPAQSPTSSRLTPRPSRISSPRRRSCSQTLSTSPHSRSASSRPR